MCLFFLYIILGQYLVSQIQSRDDVELAFVWNRTQETMIGKVDDDVILKDLGMFKER